MVELQPEMKYGRYARHATCNIKQYEYQMTFGGYYVTVKIVSKQVKDEQKLTMDRY